MAELWHVSPGARVHYLYTDEDIARWHDMTERRKSANISDSSKNQVPLEKTPQIPTTKQFFKKRQAEESPISDGEVEIISSQSDNSGANNMKPNALKKSKQSTKSTFNRDKENTSTQPSPRETYSRAVKTISNNI